ncbi:hypothetical protein B0H13DRAFT_2351446 [Mycena leptocephala]|nr:hypothetical protein B0H13DRAFT_2351446 [Mycena leptocephala]
MSEAHTPVLTLDEIKGGPINSSRTVKELVGIASAMGISTAGPKKDLLGRVQEKLSSDKTLAEKAEFLKFSIYPAQDAVEAKANLPATGAHRKLLKSEATSDPPPKFDRLTGPKDKNNDKAGVAALSSSPSPKPEFDEKDEKEPNTPRKEGRKVIVPSTPKQICVAFGGTNPREFTIESSMRVPLTVENQEGATSPFDSASLKAVLAEVHAKMDTPMKPKTKVYRGGLLNPQAASIKLGSVEEIMADKSDQIAIPSVNKYKLEPFQGMLLCKLFLVDGDDTEETKEPKHPTTLVDGSSKPLDVAQNRAAEAAELYPSKESAFISFLREILGGPENPRPAADSARDVRDRFYAVNDAVALLKSMGWKKLAGTKFRTVWTIILLNIALLIPLAAYEDSLYNMEFDYKGYVFTKEHVLKAMRVGHAAAGTDTQMMALVHHCADASAWVKSPDDEILGAKFNDMKNGALKKYLEAAKQKAKEKARRKERSMKRARHSDSDESASEKEAGPSKKKAKSKKIVSALTLTTPNDSQYIYYIMQSNLFLDL